MRIGTRALVVIVGAISVGAATLIACSSSTSDPIATPTVDASHSATDSATSTTDSAIPTSDASPADAGSDCGKAASLHPASGDGGIYCPFSATDGGKNLYCPETDECCETPSGSGASTCETKGAACPVANSTVWECESPQDCPGTGMVCCAHGAAGASVTVGQDTCGPYLSKFQGTRCSTTCAAGELVVCEAQGDCTSGTCKAVKPKANDIGVCN